MAITTAVHQPPHVRVGNGPAIAVKGVGKWYGRVRALPRCDLVLPAGSCWALLGQNGAGKSTLLRILAGLLTPSVGSGQVVGVPLDDREGLRAATALLSGEAAGYGELTAREMLTLLARLSGAGPAEAELALDRVELAARARSTRQRWLSSGESRRLGWARLLIWRRSVWLLDEPLSGLDGGGRRMGRGLLEEALASGTSVLMATHPQGEPPRPATHAVTLDESGLSSPRPLG